MGLQSTQLI